MKTGRPRKLLLDIKNPKERAEYMNRYYLSKLKNRREKKREWERWAKENLSVGTRKKLKVGLIKKLLNKIK